MCLPLITHPHLPSCSFITAVLQPCLGGSHSIVALCSCRCWLRSAQPARWKRLAPSQCNTWHLVAPGRLELSVLSPWTQHKTVFCRLPPSCLCFAAGLPASAALKPNCWTQPQVLASFFSSLSLLSFCSLQILPFFYQIFMSVNLELVLCLAGYSE